MLAQRGKNGVCGAGAGAAGGEGQYVPAVAAGHTRSNEFGGGGVLIAMRFWHYSLAAMAMAGVAAQAEDLDIEPVSMRMAPEESSSSLWISNVSQQSVQMTARVFIWLQQGGDEVLLPTDDVVLSPPWVNILPGVQQRVRVMRLNGAAQTLQERSYRIIVDAQNTQPPQSATRYSLPLFLNMQGSALVALQLCLSGEDVAHSWLRIHNAGQHHAKLVDLQYLPGVGAEAQVLMSELAGYVLPGGYKRWQLDGSAAEFAAGQFTATVNGQVQSWPAVMCLDAPAP